MRCHEAPMGPPLECCQVARTATWTPKPNSDKEYDPQAKAQRAVDDELRDVTDDEVERQIKAPLTSVEPEWEPGEIEDLTPTYRPKKLKKKKDKPKVKKTSKGMNFVKKMFSEVKSATAKAKSKHKRQDIDQFFADYFYRKRTVLRSIRWVIKIIYMAGCLATVYIYTTYF